MGEFQKKTSGRLRLSEIIYHKVGRQIWLDIGTFSNFYNMVARGLEFALNLKFSPFEGFGFASKSQYFRLFQESKSTQS